MISSANNLLDLESYVEEIEIMKPRLLSYARSRYYLSLEDAEDVYQNTFLDFVRKRNYDEKNGKFTTWFTKCFNNKCIDYLRTIMRRDNIRKFVNFTDLDFEILEFFGCREYDDYRDHEISNQINRLNNRQKRIIKMFYWEHMGYEDIAEKLKMSRGTIGSDLFYARKKLKEILMRNCSSYS